MMNRRKTLQISLIAAVAVAAAATAGILLAHRGERVWTTDSPAALAELERGLEEEQKLYREDAIEHYERALEIDPDFVAAKIFVLTRKGRELDEQRRAAIRADLTAVDRDRLSPRERYFLEVLDARWSGEPERTPEILDRYLERHPEDPFALADRCRALWASLDYPEAEACFRRLIEIDPNWVDAQNLLGYLAMAQGDWRRAEEQFAIYRYLAPDQANPHDSLGEMLLLTGRWDEAREELEQAVAIKPDFCPSWGNLFLLDMLQGRYQAAAGLTERLATDGICTQQVPAQRCRHAVWSAFTGGDWTTAATAYDSDDCEGYFGDALVMAYEAALLAGLDERAEALRTKMNEALAEPEGEDGRRALDLHLEGIRLRLEGRPEEAVERFREVDRVLAYWRPDQGYFKLANRLQLWQALSSAGEAAEAERVLADLRAVNPEIADRWTEHLRSAGGAGRVAPERSGPGRTAAPEAAEPGSPSR